MPPHDLGRDYLIAVLWAIALGVTILFWPVAWRDRWVLAVAWAVRMIVALGFMLYYEWSYSVLDAYTYFAASDASTADWAAVRVGAGTANMEVLAWLHARLLPGSYHATKVSFALIGLIASYLFYRAAVAAQDRENRGLLALLLFFPSLLFWSSILGKDPLILLGVALYCWGTVRWQRSGRMSYLIAVVSGVLVASTIRIWFAPILLGPLFLMTLVGLRSNPQRILFGILGAVVLLAAVNVFRERFALATVEELLSTTNRVSQAWSKGGSALTLSAEFTSVGGMLRFLPLGMFTALFRPLPGEVMNPFGLLAGMEDVALLLLAGAALARTRLRELREPLVLWALALVVVWAALYSFVSYQNLGTAVRFRLQILPVLLLLSLHLARRRPVALPPPEEVDAPASP